MSWLLSLEWIEAWMAVMFRAAFYGGVAILGAWLVDRLLPRMPPVVRSWIWRLVYVKLILLLLWPSPIPTGLLPGPVTRVEQAKNSSMARLEERATPADLELRQGSAPVPQRRTFPVVWFVIWLGGALLLLIRNLQNARLARKTLEEACPVSRSEFRREYEVLLGGLPWKSAPSLLQHEHLPGPQLLGLRRPSILFPAGLVAQLTAEEARLVLAHELAHVQRRDLFWALIRRLVHVPLFFHPLVWLANWQAALAEEITCDEKAVRGMTATLPQYAGILLKVTEGAAPIPGATRALAGMAMSRAYWMIARRLEALPQLRNSKRTRTGLIACLAMALLLPIGFLSLRPSSGIKQIDPRYPVLGFQVSRGQNHLLTVQREVCQFAGLKFLRVSENSGSASSPAGTTILAGGPGNGMPGRIAGWLRKAGLKPELHVNAYQSGVFVSEDSYAFIVRFAHHPEQNGYERISASLVDQEGEVIPLRARHAEFPSGSGEFVKFWVLSPAPITRANFNLLLRLEPEATVIAMLRLGEL